MAEVVEEQREDGDAEDDGSDSKEAGQDLG